jgi:hypothetical protein
VEEETHYKFKAQPRTATFFVIQKAHSACKIILATAQRNNMRGRKMQEMIISDF